MGFLVHTTLMVKNCKLSITNWSELVTTLSTLTGIFIIPEFDISEYLSNFGWAVIIFSLKTITRMHSSSATVGEGRRVVVDL